MFQQTVTNDFRKYKCVIHSANAKCKITITIRYIIKHDAMVHVLLCVIYVIEIKNSYYAGID